MKKAKKINKIRRSGSCVIKGNGGEKILSKYIIDTVYGRRCIERGRLTEVQIEAMRRSVRQNRKGIGGDISILMKPTLKVTKKPIEVRIGKGKGEVKFKVLRVKPGIIRIEVKNGKKEEVKIAIMKASKKLPIIIKFVSR